MARRWPLLALVLSFARYAAAQPVEQPTATLNWVRMPGAESCISPQALARAVEARLGHPLTVPLARAEWSIEGRVERRSGGWVATLTASRGDGAPGTRTVGVDAPDCAAIDPQLVLVVTLLLDPTRTRVDAPATPTAPPPPPPTPPPAPPQIATAPRRDPAHGDPPAAPRRVLLGAGVGFSVGWLPAPAPSMQVEAIVAPWSAYARLRASLGVVGPLRYRPDAGGPAADFLSLSADLSMCFSRPAAPWASLCAGVVAGAIRGEGAGSVRDAVAWSPAVGLGARVRFEVPVSAGWRLLASLGATLPLLWPRFALESSTAGQVSVALGPDAPVALGGEVGVGYALP